MVLMGSKDIEDKMDGAQRITRMEEILDTATAMLKDLELKLEAYEKYQSEIKVILSQQERYRE